VFQSLSRLPARIPEWGVLVHNHVTPQRHLGVRGFRAWLQEDDGTLKRCPCSWACELGPHFVRRPRCPTLPSELAAASPS
jgi:hypothetical protein